MNRKSDSSINIINPTNPDTYNDTNTTSTQSQPQLTINTSSSTSSSLTATLPTRASLDQPELDAVQLAKKQRNRVKHINAETRRRTRLREQMTQLTELLQCYKQDTYHVLESAINTIIQYKNLLLLQQQHHSSVPSPHPYNNSTSAALNELSIIYKIFHYVPLCVLCNNTTILQPNQSFCELIQPIITPTQSCRLYDIIHDTHGIDLQHSIQLLIDSHVSYVYQSKILLQHNNASHNNTTNNNISDYGLLVVKLRVPVQFNSTASNTNTIGTMLCYILNSTLNHNKYTLQSLMNISSQPSAITPTIQLPLHHSPYLSPAVQYNNTPVQMPVSMIQTYMHTPPMIPQYGYIHQPQHTSPLQIIHSNTPLMNTSSQINEQMNIIPPVTRAQSTSSSLPSTQTTINRPVPQRINVNNSNNMNIQQ